VGALSQWSASLSSNCVEIQVDCGIVVVVVGDLFNQTATTTNDAESLPAGVIYRPHTPRVVAETIPAFVVTRPSSPPPVPRRRASPAVAGRPRVLWTASIVIDPTQLDPRPPGAGRVKINANYRPTCFGLSRQRVTLAAVSTRLPLPGTNFPPENPRCNKPD